jgi:uncharacterized protein
MPPYRLDQRVHATGDPSLAGVLAHNRDEEKEHASMTLEWLRRRDPVLDRHLRTYLFTTEPVTGVVNLYLEESLSFRVGEPDAAVALRRSGTSPRRRRTR